MFQETMEAMRIMGIPEDEQMGKASTSCGRGPGAGWLASGHFEVDERPVETSCWLWGWGSPCNQGKSLKNRLGFAAGSTTGKQRKES